MALIDSEHHSRVHINPSPVVAALATMLMGMSVNDDNDDTGMLIVEGDNMPKLSILDRDVVSASVSGCLIV